MNRTSLQGYAQDRGRWYCCWGHEVKSDNGYVYCEGSDDCNRGHCSVCGKFCADEPPLPDEDPFDETENLICEDCHENHRRK